MAALSRQQPCLRRVHRPPDRHARSACPRRHIPWTAARVGNGNSSRSAIMRRWVVKLSRASLPVFPLKALTSAPAEKIPSARTICYQLPTEQIERRIRQREYAQRTRGFEMYLIHHDLLTLRLRPFPLNFTFKESLAGHALRGSSSGRAARPPPRPVGFPSQAHVCAFLWRREGESGRHPGERPVWARQSFLRVRSC